MLKTKRKNIISISILIFLMNDRVLSAATLIDFTGRSTCNVIPIEKNKALTPHHCLKNKSDLTDVIISDNSRLMHAEKIYSNKSWDFALITTKEYFQNFHNIGPIDEQPISIVAERNGEDLFAVTNDFFEAELGQPIVFYDFETQGGDSGAPIFQDGKVIAMHLGISNETSSYGKGLGLLLSGLDNVPSNEILNVKYTAQNPVAVLWLGARAWCSLNPNPCIAAIGGLFTFGSTITATVISKAVDLHIAYMNKESANQVDGIKDKLAQCEESREQIKDIIKEALKSNEREFRIEDDVVPLDRPGAKEEINRILQDKGVNVHSTGFGSGGGSGGGRQGFVRYNGKGPWIPLHMESAEETVGIFSHLTAVSVIHAITKKLGRDPTTEEFNRGMSVAWSSNSIFEIVYYAENGVRYVSPATPTHTGGWGCPAGKPNCDQEI